MEKKTWKYREMVGGIICYDIKLTYPASCMTLNPVEKYHIDEKGY